MKQIANRPLLITSTIISAIYFISIIWLTASVRKNGDGYGVSFFTIPAIVAFMNAIF